VVLVPQVVEGLLVAGAVTLTRAVLELVAQEVLVIFTLVEMVLLAMLT
jgi:hypothetical protein